MSRFKKNNTRTVPSLNTASLPDMIFTLLFFFLIVSNMREAPHKIQFRLPTATELEELDKQSLVTYLFVNKAGEIQLDRTMVSLDGIEKIIVSKREELSPGNRERMVVALKIDKDAKMGLVNDIRQIIRNSGVTMIHFSAEKQSVSL